MLVVLVYHAGLPFFPHGYIGVDVFFVISGFLITSLLLRELADTGTISWSRFLARRARRLLPAAILVLLFVALVTWQLIPGRRGREIGGDVIGAAVYVVNWVLAGRSVDYLAQDALPSPVQHYWSLAVEEQFYVLWPLALIGLVLVLRVVRPRALGGSGGSGPPLRAVAVLLALLAVPSFAYSVWHTATTPAHAYFVTTTRAWELAIGAALAVWAASRSFATVPRGRLIGWLGLAAVVASAVLLPRDVGWPGAWALAPTLGTAAVILAGTGTGSASPVDAHTRSANGLLSLGPLVWIGGLSYSLYLWHWPLRVFAEELWTHPVAIPLAVLASVVPAWLGYRLVERPLHLSPVLARRTAPALALGIVLPLAGVLAGLPLVNAEAVWRTQPVSGPMPPLEELGAGVLGDHPSADPRVYAIDTWEWLTPDPERAGEDRPSADVDRCQVSEESSTPVRCEFGDGQGSATVALVGDSKALQWLPALERAAPGRGWRIITYGKSSCAFAEGETTLSRQHYQACDEWNASVVQELMADPPDLVVTSTQADAAWRNDRESERALVDQLSGRWRALQETGVPVAVIGDNPGSPADLDTCVARYPWRLTRCAFDRDEALRNTGLDAQRAAVLKAPGVSLIDLTPWICPVQRCPVAIGNVVIHRPGDHITATYARTLGPQVARQLDAVMARGAP